MGETLWIGRTNVMVERVIHTSGGTILFFDNSGAVAVGEVVSRPAAATVIEAPLPRAFGTGEPARGVARMQLAMTTRHFAGNTGVPDGLPAVEWGVNRFDPQSETNPVEDGIRHVPIVTLDVPPETHLTEHTWTDSHQLGVRVTGSVVETTVNGIVIDQRELEGDQLRRSGSIGFGRGSSANINRVAIRSSDGPALDIDPTRGHNPFEGGVPGPSGLRIGSVAAMLPIANPAPLLRYRFPVPDQPLARARLYVTAAGQHEFTLDGQELSVHVPALAGAPTTARLLPHQTSFDSTVLYNTFDVTDYLVPGTEAVLAAELGRGWFGVTTATQWYWNQTAFNGAPRLLAHVAVDIQTVRGMIACESRRDPGGALDLSVQVPANTRAGIWCPDANGNVEAPPELDFVGVREHGKVVYRVYTAGAGKHRLAGSVAVQESSSAATERRSPIRS